VPSDWGRRKEGKEKEEEERAIEIAWSALLNNSAPVPFLCDRFDQRQLYGKLPSLAESDFPILKSSTQYAVPFHIRSLKRCFPFIGER
jgi:hypothetical protein